MRHHHHQLGHQRLRESGRVDPGHRAASAAELALRARQTPSSLFPTRRSTMNLISPINPTCSAKVPWLEGLALNKTMGAPVLPAAHRARPSWRPLESKGPQKKEKPNPMKLNMRWLGVLGCFHSTGCFGHGGQSPTPYNGLHLGGLSGFLFPAVVPVPGHHEPYAATATPDTLECLEWWWCCMCIRFSLDLRT